MPPVPPTNDAGRELIERLEPHLSTLAEYAEVHDRDASFPVRILRSAPRDRLDGCADPS